MLPGTKRIQYLEENAGAFHIKLSMAEQEALESIFHPDQVYCRLVSPDCRSVDNLAQCSDPTQILTQQYAAMPGGGWPL